MSNVTPKWIKDKATILHDKARAEYDKALESIPKKYHHFIVPMLREVNLATGNFYIDSEAERMGIVADREGLAVLIEKPYITVEGKIAMFRDEHLRDNKKFEIHKPEIEKVADNYLIVSVTIASEIYGHATGVIEVNPHDSKPIANAQTGAIGRALSFLGIGLIGATNNKDAEEPEVVSEAESTKIVTPQEEESKVVDMPNDLPDWFYGDQENYSEFSVIVLTPPTPTPDGGVLIEQVRHPDGRITKLWYPPKLYEQGMKSKVNQKKNFLPGWYDPKTNCVNVPEIFSASIPVVTAYKNLKKQA